MASETHLEEQTQGNGRAEEAPELAPEQQPVASHLERLRAKRAEKVTGARTDLAIPGYDGDLLCRYRALTWDELKRIGEKAEKSRHPQRELHAHADTLILACEGFYVRDQGELKPLDLDDPEPITYADGERIASALGFQPQKSARETVLQVFGLANTPGLAVSAQHNELAEWMQGANREADEETLGES